MTVTALVSENIRHKMLCKILIIGREYYYKIQIITYNMIHIHI